MKPSRYSKPISEAERQRIMELMQCNKSTLVARLIGRPIHTVTRVMRDCA